MSGPYPQVPLGEVLTEAKEWIILQPQDRYTQVTVRLWGKGVVARGTLPGAEIAAPRQVVVRAGQFILSRIDARNGAFGIVPEDLDGAVVSNDFPVYTPNPNRILPAYLGWLSRTHRFVDVCRQASEGTTNRKRLKEDRFLAACIPLPRLDEQRRIVAWINAVAGKIEAARGLRENVSASTSDLFCAAIDRQMNWLHEQGHPTARVGELEMLITSGPRNFGSRYSMTGLRFYRAQDVDSSGTISDASIVYVEVPKGMTTRAIVQPGDILVVITGATIGRSALIRDEHKSGLVSQHVGIVRVDTTRVEPTFLHYALQSRVWAGGQLDELKYGQGKPGLNLSNLRSLMLPLPSKGEQCQVVAHLNRLRMHLAALSHLQQDASVELDALLPAVLERAFTSGL